MLNKGYVDSILYARLDHKLSKSLADSLIEFYFELIYEGVELFEPKVEIGESGLTIKAVALDHVSCSDLMEILKKTLATDKEKTMLTKLNAGKRKITYQLVTDILADNGYKCFVECVSIPECTYFSIELR